MDLSYLRSGKIFLFFIAVLLTNCTTKSNQWNKANIDPAISKDSIYRQLDNQVEIFDALEEHDSLMKRTSDVAYLSRFRIGQGIDEYFKNYNCRAYFFDSDTLSINIGIGNGFGGQGFIIKYKDKKFYAEPYFSTDVIVVGEAEPTYKIVYQELSLDKLNYKLGDSLYGKIEFKSIETDKDLKKEVYFGKGSFRTKVKKLGM